MTSPTPGLEGVAVRRGHQGEAWSIPVGDGLELVGRSPALMAVVEVVRRVAPTKLPVLIVGDTGTGKELLARLVHRWSGRRGELMDLDCGSLPGDLIESLLFGHKRGAFTGATHDSTGAIEEADAGTLFLDELGSLPERGQAKLLRVLETGRIRRLGGTRSRSVDFRVVATMQEDVSELLRAGRFRPDLMQRVAGAVVRVPPLAERTADIPSLARYFARRHQLDLEPGAATILSSRAWPGNVRELRWTMERAALFAEGGTVGPRALREALDLGPRNLLAEGNGSLSRRAELRAACRMHGGCAEDIADSLGIGRSTLYRWLKEEGLALRAFKQQVS